MSVGGGIFMFVVGAILAFAVRDNWDVLDLTMVGYILMGAGALLAILGIAFAFKKRSAVTETRSAVDPVSGEGVTRSERSIG